MFNFVQWKEIDVNKAPFYDSAHRHHRGVPSDARLVRLEKKNPMERRSARSLHHPRKPVSKDDKPARAAWMADG